MTASEPVHAYHQKWLRNAERRGISRRGVVEIAGRAALTAASFEILDGMEEVVDPDGKSFFLLAPETPGAVARRAALLTYILNAGTDYGAPGRVSDFPAAPCCAEEVARIADRQRANGWTYARDVRFVDRNGGRLATTPEAILMGVGGNWIQRRFSRRGGTTWGDIFMVNTASQKGRVTDPAGELRRIIRAGRVGRVDLDRILHHEERHSRQWASKGYAGMVRDYGWELVRELAFGQPNRLEEDAGLSDGGYR